MHGRSERYVQNKFLTYLVGIAGLILGGFLVFAYFHFFAPHPAPPTVTYTELPQDTVYIPVIKASSVSHNSSQVTTAPAEGQNVSEHVVSFTYSTSVPEYIDRWLHNGKDSIHYKDTVVHVFQGTSNCNNAELENVYVISSAVHPPLFIEHDTTWKSTPYFSKFNQRPVDYWISVGRDLTLGKYAIGAGIEIPIRIPFITLPDISVSFEPVYEFGNGFHSFANVNYHF